MAATQNTKNALNARIGIIPLVRGFSRMICWAWARVAQAAASWAIVAAAARCRRSRHRARVAALAGMVNSLLRDRGMGTAHEPGHSHVDGRARTMIGVGSGRSGQPVSVARASVNSR